MPLRAANAPEFLEKIRKNLVFTESLPTLRICVTEKCTIACFYCHREGMKEEFHDYLSISDYEFLAKAFRDLGLKKVKITGGEPLLRPELAEIIKTFKQAGYEDVSIVTNGTILNAESLQKLKQAGLDRITISIDTLRKKNAEKINKCPNIEKVLENAVLAKKFFEKVKINCVMVPGINFPNEILEIANFCRDNGLTLKLLSQLSEDNPYPSNHQALSSLKTYKTLVKKELAKNSPVLMTRYFFSDGTVVDVNAIQTDEYYKKIAEHPFCKGCTYKAECVEGPCAIRIMPNGDVKPCLVREDNIIRFKKPETIEVKS